MYTVKSPDLARPLILHTPGILRLTCSTFHKKGFILIIRKNKFALPIKNWFCMWQYFIFLELQSLVFHGKFLNDDKCHYVNHKDKNGQNVFDSGERTVRLKGSIGYQFAVYKQIYLRCVRWADIWTLSKTWRPGRFPCGCTLARFLDISVICLCSYVLDMFFPALNHKLELPLEKPNASLSAQDPRAASYLVGTKVVICNVCWTLMLKYIIFPQKIRV